jgi:hypothetical protein
MLLRGERNLPRKTRNLKCKVSTFKSTLRSKEQNWCRRQCHYHLRLSLGVSSTGKLPKVLSVHGMNHNAVAVSLWPITCLIVLTSSIHRSKPKSELQVPILSCLPAAKTADPQKALLKHWLSCSMQASSRVFLTTKLVACRKKGNFYSFSQRLGLLAVDITEYHRWQIHNKQRFI